MSLFHTGPFFQNSHTDEPTALGLTIQPKHRADGTLDHYLCYYLSAAAPPAALGSIWASLVNNNHSTLLCHPWANAVPITGAPPIKKAAKPFKSTGVPSGPGHLLAYSHRPDLIVVTDPAGAALTNPNEATDTQRVLDAKTQRVGELGGPLGASRQALLQSRLPLAFARLEAWLQAHSTLPCRPGWGEIFWPHIAPTLDPGQVEQPPTTPDQPPTAPPLALQPLQTFGDCLAAWLINPAYNWPALAKQLTQNRAITLS